MSEPIDMTEVEPGRRMTRRQAKAHRIVKRAINTSDFTGTKWRLEEAIARLPLSLRICIFLLFSATLVAFFLGPLKILGDWLFYS